MSGDVLKILAFAAVAFLVAAMALKHLPLSW
jgi:hypothetical protein